MPLSIPEEEFGQFLRERALLATALLEQAREVSRTTRDPFVRSLSKLGFVPDAALAGALVEFCGLARCGASLRICDEPTGLAPPFLKAHGLVPVARDGQTLTIACDNPLDPQGLRGVEFVTGLKVIAQIATVGEVDAALQALDLENTPT